MLAHCQPSADLGNFLWKSPPNSASRVFRMSQKTFDPITPGTFLFLSSIGEFTGP